MPPRTSLAGLLVLTAIGPAPGCSEADAPAPAAKSPAAPAAQPPLDPLLVDGTERSGIDFVHVHGGVGNREAPETMGGGVGLFDFEGDGDLDAYLVQSGPVRLPGDVESRAGGENALWANRGDAVFDRVEDAAGADDDGYGMGCAVGDVDGDGLDDLLVLNWGPNVLYSNRKGRFEDVTETAGLGRFDDWSVSAAFFDSEGDGDLDLYLVNYVIAEPASYLNEGRNPRAPLGFRMYPTPDAFPAERDRLLLNRGNRRSAELSRFEDAGESSGVTSVAGKGLGVVITDVDLDGLTDLYVANDGTPNFLFHNRGENRFEEIAREAGVAFNDDGFSEAGMGVDEGDVDGDGDLDLVVTNLDNETNSLYLNRGTAALGFRDRTRTSGLAEPSRTLLGFGALLEDFDLDGDLDFLVGNGHVLDNVEIAHSERSHAQPNQLFLNEGGRFTVAPPERLGPGVGDPYVTRGTAAGDLDGDGFQDVLVGNNRGPAQVLLSRPRSDEWLRVELEGPPGNPHALGATLWIVTGDGERILRRVKSARSYASASEPAVVTGVPGGCRSVEVLWPDGARSETPMTANGSPATGGTRILRHPALLGHERVRQDG